jgi:hypothetical protein
MNAISLTLARALVPTGERTAARRPRHDGTDVRGRHAEARARAARERDAERMLLLTVPRR